MSNAKQVAPLTALKQTLMSAGMKEQIEHALPKGVPVEKFIRNTMTLLSQNPDLVKADRNSLFSAIMSGAALGLMPDTFLGEFYVVTYKNKASAQIGYKGLLTLARRSGEISNIEHGVVYEKDNYVYRQGDQSELVIHPYMGNNDPGEPVFAWAVITLRDGSKMREVMKAYEIEAIRKASPSGNSPAWKNAWSEMARKTVLRRILKTAPRSTELGQALAMDEASDRGEILAVTNDGIEQVEAAEAPKPEAKRKSRVEQLKESVAPDEPDDEPVGENEPPATIDGDTGVVV